MKVWIMASVVLRAAQCMCAEGYSVSAGPSEPSVLVGLDAAIAFTANLASASLCLVQSAGLFAVAESATINSRLTIDGNAQVIAFFKTLNVRGSLSILNSTLKSNMTFPEFPMISLSSGSISISNSSLAGSNATVVAGAGTVTITSTNFANNSAPTISIDSGRFSIEISKCDVWRHRGEFLRVAPTQFSAAGMSVLVDQSTFRENKGEGALFNYSAPLLSGTFVISNSNFSQNEIPQVYMSAGAIDASFTSCTFLRNKQSALKVFAEGATFSIRDSLSKGNFQAVFSFRQFTGYLEVTNLTATDQRQDGVVQVNDTRASGQCLLVLQDSSFLDTFFRTNTEMLGGINGYGCMMHLRRIVVRNFLIAATRQRYVASLIGVWLGSLVIAEMQLQSSGSTSLGMGAALGDLTVVDSVLDDLSTGAGVPLGVTSGTLTVRNVTITNSRPFWADDFTVGAYPFYMSVMTGHLEATDVLLLPGATGLAFSTPFGLRDATYNISNVVARNTELATLAGMGLATGEMTNITVIKSAFGVSFFQFFSNATLRLSGLVVEDSYNMRRLYGIFGLSKYCNIDIRDIRLKNATFDSFSQSKESVVRMSNLQIVHSSFSYIALSVNSTVVIERMTVRDSRGGLLSSLYSTVRITDSSMQSLSATGFVLEGSNSNVALQSVRLQDFSSLWNLGRFKEDSQLDIDNCLFRNYTSQADEGFLISTTTLSLTDSRFQQFNVALMQASDSEVAISHCQFQDGRVTVLSRKSSSAYGGVLGCVDCSSVAVQSSSFLNVSAIYGGALAVRNSAPLDALQVYIGNCEFIMCEVTASGGAVYILNVAYTIEFSTFWGNKANEMGGAIDVSTGLNQSSLILNSTFFSNSAKEGGAVKWRNAEVLIENSTFLENSATYGPDFASYGVALVGNATSLAGMKVNGYPVQLVFELQDHDGQRVATASTQDLQLNTTARVDFRGNNATVINQGVFNFSLLIVYAEPKSHQQIHGFMSEGGKSVLTAAIDMDFRECVRGEISRPDQCEYCFPGTVSFDPADRNCSVCPKHAFCQGGNVLQVDPHYWRSALDTMRLVECPLAAACLGGEGSECAEGYAGQVCNECAEGFARYRTIQCEQCGISAVLWMKLALIPIPLAGFSIAVRTASDVRLFILKQAVNHAQLLSMMSYIRASFPDVIKHSLHSLSYLSSLFITELPLACFSVTSPDAVRALIGSGVTPTVAATLFALNFYGLKDRVRQSTSALMFTPMISLAAQMPLLACQAVESDVEWLFLDMSKQCWQGTHLLLVKAVIVPTVILNVLLPAAVLSVLSVLAPDKFDAYFPLWRSGGNWRCWDLLQYGSKAVLLCLLAVSMVADQLSQVTYGLLVLVVVSVITVSLNTLAYVHWKLFFLQEASLVLVAVSMGLSASFIYHSAEGARAWIVSSLFLVLNAGYFAVCVKLWAVPPDLTVESPIPTPCDYEVPPNSMAEGQFSGQDKLSSD